MRKIIFITTFLLAVAGAVLFSPAPARAGACACDWEAYDCVWDVDGQTCKYRCPSDCGIGFGVCGPGSYRCNDYYYDTQGNKIWTSGCCAIGTGPGGGRASGGWYCPAGTHIEYSNPPNYQKVCYTPCWEECPGVCEKYGRRCNQCKTVCGTEVCTGTCLSKNQCAPPSGSVTWGNLNLDPNAVPGCRTGGDYCGVGKKGNPLSLCQACSCVADPPKPTCTVDLTQPTSSVYVGDNILLVASIATQGGTVEKVDFSSSNVSIATVSPASDTTASYTTTANGVSPGSATITASVFMSGVATCSDTSTIQVIAPDKAWWQVKDGDVVSNGNLTSLVPLASTFFENGAGGYPGIPVYSGSLNPREPKFI